MWLVTFLDLRFKISMLTQGAKEHQLKQYAANPGLLIAPSLVEWSSDRQPSNQSTANSKSAAQRSLAGDFHQVNFCPMNKTYLRQKEWDGCGDILSLLTLSQLSLHFCTLSDEPRGSKMTTLPDDSTSIPFTFLGQIVCSP